MQKDQIEHSTIRTVLFDLDGTLLDSFPHHYAAYEDMFANFGIEITKELFLSSYSPNWYRTYEAFGLAEEYWEAANEIWLRAASGRTAELFPGVDELLKTLEKTHVLGIVTSGSKSRVTQDLERLGIANRFGTVVTGDDIREPKPAPEGLLRALDDLALSPAEAVYVGDAQADFEMANAAGVSFVGVKSEFANLAEGHSEYNVYPFASLAEVLGNWK